MADVSKKTFIPNLSQDIGLYNGNYSNTRPKVSEISAPVCAHYPTTDPPPFTECFCIHLYLFCCGHQRIEPRNEQFPTSHQRQDPHYYYRKRIPNVSMEWKYGINIAELFTLAATKALHANTLAASIPQSETNYSDGLWRLTARIVK